ncbi:sugar phosphate isomerase/epimerase family protein [Nocardioides speluncae]|uniref:sugar phosphate isomerase/epimerase family protein n=1 Tax=Nocardioides speluncae TaxID=2670337 RepID=UPI000D688263|nr:sugar phosphate isomerase/epimerase [Nocardioides speluncae]
MSHEISVNPACYRWGTTLAEFVAVSRAAGFTSVEVSIQQAAALADALGGLNALRQWRRQAGVEVVQFSGILPAGPVLPAPLLVDDADFATALSTLDRHLAVADALDCRRAAIVVNPRTSLPLPEATDCALNRLDQLADHADRHGIRLAVEFIGVRRDLNATLDGPHPFIGSAAGLLGLLDELDRATVGVLLDTSHLYASGDSLTDLPDLRGRIGFVQVADVPRGLPPGELTDAVRCLPGTGGTDFECLLPDLDAAGYDGPLSIELFSPELWQLAPADAAAQLFDSTAHLRPHRPATVAAGRRQS